MKGDPLTIIHGDALSALRTLESESVQTCVTSPPYWGLRDYGVEGQLGLEKTPEEYVARLVEVFHELKRVLRGDGTLWLNLGDSYAGSNQGHGCKELWPKQKSNRGTEWMTGKTIPRLPDGLKAKDLIGIPWLVAFALRADGWYLRSDIIWSKPNPMPESVTDRPTKAHEYIFLLSRNQKYFFDADAVREPPARPEWMYETATTPGNGDRNDGGCTQRKQRGHTRPHDGFNSKWDLLTKQEQSANGRNIRTVWTVATYPFPDAHFATFPPELIKPCILAGAPVGGVVVDPFAGSGTTAKVAIELGRKAIAIEPKAEYVEMIKKRCQTTIGLPLAI